MKKRLMTILLVVTVGLISGCGKGEDVNLSNAKADLEDTRQETEAEETNDDNSDEKVEKNEAAGTNAGNNNETDTNKGNAENSNESETVQSNETVQGNETVETNETDGSNNETGGSNEMSSNNGTDGNNEKAADGENTDGTDSGSQNIYEVCTSLPKAEVEAFAGQVKQQIVNHDWKGLSENISYPITVGGTTYQNSDEFAAGNFEESLSQKFVDAIEAETCTDMFCNWQGIMMGNGEVWISEVLNDDSSSQGLKVTAINGMVE